MFHELRFAPLALALAFTAAPPAGATCTDTLSLASLRSFRATLTDTTEDLVWDSLELGPGELGRLPVLTGKPFAGSLVALHPLQFASNCDGDSTDTATWLRTVDSSAEVRGETVWAQASSVLDSTWRVVSAANATLDGTTYQRYWDLTSGDGRFLVGRLAGDQPRSWTVEWRLVLYATSGARRGSWGEPYSVPSRDMAFEQVDEVLASVADRMDSVGSGYDSARLELLLTESLFRNDTLFAHGLGTAALAGNPVRGAASGLRATVLPGEVRFEQAEARAVVVRDVRGRVVARLAPSRAPTWIVPAGLGRGVFFATAGTGNLAVLLR